VARRNPAQEHRVKRSPGFHPRTPRLISLRLLRDLYLMDLVQVAILPGVSAELKRNAETNCWRAAATPLAENHVARRARRVVPAALLAEGHAQVISIVLDNPT